MAMVLRPRETRIPVRVDVRITDAQLSSPVETDSLNLSLGGMCLRSGGDYAVGHPVHLEMMLSGEPVDLDGVVAWVRPDEPALGVRFVEMPLDVERRLETVVSLLAASSA
jgi:uncharacterized protein (TIGR02266 family)